MSCPICGWPNSPEYPGYGGWPPCTDSSQDFARLANAGCVFADEAIPAGNPLIDAFRQELEPDLRRWRETRR